jgi:hypothetical protein
MRKFSAKHADFQELLPVIDTFWKTGQYDLQEAYDLAKKAKSGKDPFETPAKGGAGKPPTKEDKEEKPISSIPTSSEAGNGDTSELKPKFKDTHAAATANFDRIIAKLDSNPLKEEEANLKEV